MAKKIIKTKKSKQKQPIKKTIKKIKTKLPTKKTKKIIPTPKKTVSKIKKIKKPSKTIIKKNLQPTKIIVETKKENWFVKLIKSIVKITLILLPFILIGGGIWLVISKFFPEVAAKIGGVVDTCWQFIKDTCHNLDDKTKKALENAGIDPKYSAIASKVLWLVGGCLLAAACCLIPGIGTFLGGTVLISTIAYIGTITLTEKTNQEPPKNTSPPQQVENKVDNTNKQIEPDKLTENNRDSEKQETQKKKKTTKSTELNDETPTPQPTLKQPIHKQKEINKEEYNKSLLNPDMQKQVEELLQHEKAKNEQLLQERNYFEANLQAQQLEMLNIKNQKDNLEKELAEQKNLSDAEKQQLTKQIADINTNLTSKNEELNNLKKDQEAHAELRQELYDVINKDKENLQQKTKQLEEQKNLSDAEKQQLTKQIADINTNLTSKNEELNNLNQKLEEAAKKQTELNNFIQTQENNLEQIKTSSEEKQQELNNKVKDIQTNLNRQEKITEDKNKEIEQMQSQKIQLENQLASNKQDLDKLQQKIFDKEVELEEKERKLTEQKDLSANEVKQLNSEINNLKNNINQEKVNFEVQLSLKEGEIKQLQENEKNLKQQLSKTQTETMSLREQHVKTLEEIQKQITNYKNMVSELENETQKLKEQIEKNNENAKQLQKELKAKQAKLDEINKTIGILTANKDNLLQTITFLENDTTITDWQKSKNQKEYSYDTSSKEIQFPRFWNDKPFTYKIVPKIDFDKTGLPYIPRSLRTYNEMIRRNTIQGESIELSPGKYYCEPSINMRNIPYSTNGANLIFSEPTSQTEPPQNLIKLDEAKENLKNISQELSNYKTNLKKTQLEYNQLLENQTPDDSLQQELNNKANHIKTLKNEMQKLEIKEQGFRSEIYTLKLENKNLKEKYTNDLTKIQQELDATKTENNQLEKEMQEIQVELVKNGNVDEALVKQLNHKEAQIKELKGKITNLEANETKLQETIKQKDEEIKQLQETIQEQAEQIIKLTAEIENNIETFKQQAMKIQQLEGAIAGLEDANGAMGGNNKELLHEINKLKAQLKAEQKAHVATKIRLEKKIVKLQGKNLKLTNDSEQLKEKEKHWEDAVKNVGTAITIGVSTKAGVMMGAAWGSAAGPIGTVVGGTVGGVIAGAAAVSSKWDVVKTWFGR
ncbi:Conserved hypothetical protein [Candidatus Phytoplasma australiense]|uniref:Uncharacterized protein n=1 Tax=Phytoplasma australiense TaxID=59748 RepID=B1VB09_PHYAS|nr:Conserved hypothetical protein [Candidatus Phytoplasma australiense]